MSATLASESARQKVRFTWTAGVLADIAASPFDELRVTLLYAPPPELASC
jgi:hypothetical protein